MNSPNKWITEKERQDIARMLRSGRSALEVQRRTGRSAYAIRRIRDAFGIPLTPAESTPEPRRRPAQATPWVPPSGYDPFVERHHQRKWLELLDAAGLKGRDEERSRLRAVVCRVLGLSVHASDDMVIKALIADRHTADELAAMYLAEAGRAG